MDPNYRYKGACLKPKIAKAIILEQFAGKTMSRREIDDGVIQHHQSNGGLPSTAKTNPIKAVLRYLKGKKRTHFINTSTYGGGSQSPGILPRQIFKQDLRNA